MMAAALGLGLYACNGGNTNNNNNNNNNSNNQPPAAFTEQNVQEPVANSTYQIGDLVPVQFTVPTDPDGDTLTGEATIAVDENGNGVIDAGEATKTEDLGSVVGGDTVNDGIDTTGLPAGDAYVTIKVNDGKGGESSLERAIELTAVAGDYVEGCVVNTNTQGGVLSIQCRGYDSEGQQLVGQDVWNIKETDYANAVISPSGLVGSSAPIGAPDLGIKRYVVTAGDSADYEFFVPNDVTVTEVTVGCNGNSKTYKVPNTTADTIGDESVDAYNNGVAQTWQARNITDALTAYDGMTQQEKTTVEDNFTPLEETPLRDKMVECENEASGVLEITRY